MHTSEFLTAEDLERMGGQAHQFELVRGRLVRMNPPNFEHGRVALEIGAALLAFVRERGLGRVVVESGYTLSREPDTVRGPDVSFVRAGRPDFPPTHGFVSGPPDLAVEVRSPDDSMAELLTKAGEYLAAGAELVWIVDPESRTALVIDAKGSTTLGADGALAGGSCLPGFALSLAELFGGGGSIPQETKR